MLEDGKCMYEGLCRRSIVVYEYKCITTGKSYIGKTQCHLKQDLSYGRIYATTKLLASLQAHDIAGYHYSDRVGHSFGKPCSLA